jgi:hypothetical protein
MLQTYRQRIGADDSQKGANMTRLLPNVRLQPMRLQEQQLQSQAALLFTTYLIICCVSTAEGLYGVVRPLQNEPDSHSVEERSMICSSATMPCERRSLNSVAEDADVDEQRALGVVASSGCTLSWFCIEFINPHQFPS